MEKSAEKNVLFLVFAGAVLILANMVIVMGVRNGQISPVDNLTLWGAFAVLNICSLLWAVSLLGLQPMVVAVSYVAGGLLAFYGVRMTPGVNVAEIATAGATYSAFGALLVGNATTRVRLAFFAKRQIPFVFIILSLLVMDGFLNSRISKSDWHIITTAVIYPFLFSGVVVGLVWMLISRVRAEKPASRTAKASSDELTAVAAEDSEDEESAHLMFSVPDSAVEEEQEALEEVAVIPEPVTAKPADVILPGTLAVEMEAKEEEDQTFDTFFPLEIDTSDEEVTLEENPELLDVAAMVADHVSDEPAATLSAEPLDADPDVNDPIDSHLMETNDVSAMPVEEETPLPEPAEQAAETDLEEGNKAGAGDWLDGHMDLLNKLK